MTTIETIERLEHADWGNQGSGMEADTDGRYVRYEDMVAIVAKYKHDAERYRFLREHPSLAMEEHDPVWLRPEELDSAVDAALIESAK